MLNFRGVYLPQQNTTSILGHLITVVNLPCFCWHCPVGNMEDDNWPQKFCTHPHCGFTSGQRSWWNINIHWKRSFVCHCLGMLSNDDWGMVENPQKKHPGFDIGLRHLTNTKFLACGRWVAKDNGIMALPPRMSWNFFTAPCAIITVLDKSKYIKTWTYRHNIYPWILIQPLHYWNPWIPVFQLISSCSAVGFPGGTTTSRPTAKIGLWKGVVLQLLPTGSVDGCDDGGCFGKQRWQGGSKSYTHR